MKAVPHPDKGGEPAPLLFLPPARERPTIGTLSRLYGMLIYVEQQLAAGPWDRWDAAVLDEWRASVKAHIRDAEEDLRDQIDPDRFIKPDYEIVEPL